MQPISLVVLSFESDGGPNNNTIFIGEYAVTHTYAVAGTHTAKIAYSPDNVVSTLVEAGRPNGSPVSLAGRVVEFDYAQRRATYQLPATDPDGDALTYSLATAAEVGSSSPSVNLPELSIDPRTGLLTLINIAGDNGRYYSTAYVKVSDGKTSIIVEQLFSFVKFANTAPPVFTAPTPPAGPLEVYGSGPITFTVRATDADAHDVVTLRATGLPPGATLTPMLPTSGNPVQTTFTWTPVRNSPDAVYPLTFTAEDSRGRQTTITYQLEFHGYLAPEFVAPTPPDRQVLSVEPGQTVQFTVKVIDNSGLYGGLVLLRPLRLPRGATLTPSVDTNQTIEATFTWTPTAADSGTYNVVFEALDRSDLHAYTGVTIQVGASCNPVATQPVARADFFTTGAGIPLTITPAQLLANDTDPRGTPLQVARVSSPSRGTLVTNPDGTFTYTPAPGIVSASFTYVLQPAGPVLASPATGHYYEFVAAPGICWADARDAAAARTYQGMRGYLATVTSAAETAFLAGRSADKLWLGGADDEVEGEWRWKTGPEAGQLFWRGGPDGAAPAYANWSPGEPNDYKNEWRPAGEDYASLYGGSGLWNDLANCGEGSNVAGYIVEYGGLEACTPVLFATGTAVITVGGAAARVASAASAGTAAPALLEAAPNPSPGQFRVRVTAAADGPAQLDLFDLQGRRVRTLYTGGLHAGEPRDVSVDAPELATGVYLVRLQTGKQVQNLRVLIQK